MADITDAGPRLRAMNDALEGFDQMRAEIERLRDERWIAVSEPMEPAAWEYDYQSPNGMGREVTLSPPWLFDPDRVRNGRPLFRVPAFGDEAKAAILEAAGCYVAECDELQAAGVVVESKRLAVADTLRGLLERTTL